MEERGPTREVSIRIGGKAHRVPADITVLKALELIGYDISRHPQEEGLSAPCRVGGCLSCSLLIDGEPLPACITGVRDGMTVEPLDQDRVVPRRLIHGFYGHAVGGVGTPWWLKGGPYSIEVAGFACGCNFRCPQCQNWTTAYCGKGIPLTAEEAAVRMTWARQREGVNRMAISGGEATLNRPWLIRFVRELRRLNPDQGARVHVDTNGSMLTPDYLDELIEAGMTDIGIDLKALNLDTFIRITGVEDAGLAARYLQSAWDAVRYLSANYEGRVFLGIGIPYNRDLISLGEIEALGREIAKIDPGLQVCILDYRPEFRRKYLREGTISRPSPQEMREIYGLLKDRGLKTVICQTSHGHIGP